MLRNYVLTVDSGNTRTKVALFEDGILIRSGVLNALTRSRLNEWVTNPIPQKIIFSATGQSVSSIVTTLRGEGFWTHELTHESKLPFTSAYETPHTLGRDRIAGVAGAQSLFPATNLLVIDAGTCITLDVLTANGVYQGGNISPGVEMRLRAMHEQTQRLPLVAAQPAPSRIGKTTEQALQNGAILGAQLEIQGYVEWCRRKYDNLTVVTTGGNTSLLVDQFKTRIFADAFLVLRGLHKISTLYEDC